MIKTTPVHHVTGATGTSVIHRAPTEAETLGACRDTDPD